MRDASAGDQEPERKVRLMLVDFSVERKEARREGVSSRSFCSGEVGEIKGGEVVVAQVRRRLGRVVRRSTEAL